MSDTALPETSNTLLVKNSANLQSNAAALKGNHAPLEQNHGVVAGDGATLADNSSTIRGNALGLDANRKVQAACAPKSNVMTKNMGLAADNHVTTIAANTAEITGNAEALGWKNVVTEANAAVMQGNYDLPIAIAARLSVAA